MGGQRGECSPAEDVGTPGNAWERLGTVGSRVSGWVAAAAAVKLPLTAKLALLVQVVGLWWSQTRRARDVALRRCAIGDARIHT